MVTSPNCKSDLNKSVQRSNKMPGKHKNSSSSSSKGGQGQQQKQPATTPNGKKNGHSIPRRVSAPSHVTPVKSHKAKHPPTTPRKVSTPKKHLETTPNDNVVNRQQQQQSVQMGQLSSSPSSSSFAGSKCYEPPTPQSLPRPPTSWTAGQQQDLRLNGSKSSPFQDLVSSMLGREQEERQGESRVDSNNIQSVNIGSDEHDEKVSQHLKFLLKVQA